MTAQKETRYPLLFSFRDKVAGKGFLADITVHGRALAVEEDGCWWIRGVQPGGLADGGQTFLEAYAAFRDDFRAVLFDIAEEAKSFWAFKEEVDRFFAETDEEAEWHAAVQAVRDKVVRPEGLQVEGTGLRQEPAEKPRYIEVREVTRMQTFEPGQNQLDQATFAA
jgi:hypothetical protein